MKSLIILLLLILVSSVLANEKYEYKCSSYKHQEYTCYEPGEDCKKQQPYYTTGCTLSERQVESMIEKEYGHILRSIKLRDRYKAQQMHEELGTLLMNMYAIQNPALVETTDPTSNKPDDYGECLTDFTSSELVCKRNKVTCDSNSSCEVSVVKTVFSQNSIDLLKMEPASRLALPSDELIPLPIHPDLLCSQGKSLEIIKGVAGTARGVLKRIKNNNRGVASESASSTRQK